MLKLFVAYYHMDGHPCSQNKDYKKTSKIRSPALQCQQNKWSFIDRLRHFTHFQKQLQKQISNAERCQQSCNSMKLAHLQSYLAENTVLITTDKTLIRTSLKKITQYSTEENFIWCKQLTCQN